MAEDYREEEIIVPLRCPNCGGLNPPENKVCQLCGFRLVGATPVSPPGVEMRSGSEPPDVPATPSPAIVESLAPVPPPDVSRPSTPSARGSGLAARLGGASSAAPPPAEWLGDLRRNIGGDAPTLINPPTASQPAPPPEPARSASGLWAAPTAQGDEQLGYVAPPTPTISPYRRDDLPGPTNKPVDWLASLRASSSLSPETEPDAAADQPEDAPIAIPDWLRNLRASGAPAAGVAAEEDEGVDAPPWLTDEVAPDTGPLDRAESVTAPAKDLPPWLRDGTDTLDPSRVDQFAATQNAAEGQVASIPPWKQQPPEPAPPARPDFSDWFTNRAATNVAPAEQALPSTTTIARSGSFLEDSDAPAWLREVAAAAPPPMPQAMSDPPPTPAAEPLAVEEGQSPEVAEPDAVDEAIASAAPSARLQPPVSDGETEVGVAPEADEAATDQADELVNDQAEAEVDAIAPQTDTGSAPEAATTIPRPTTSGGLVSGEDLPPWLRVVGGESAASGATLTVADTTVAPPTTTSFFPGDTAEDTTVPDWLRGIGRDPQDVTPASAEALTASVAEPVQRIQRVMSVRQPRPGAAEALAALVATPSASTRTAPLELKGEHNVPASLMRWLLSERGIYLLTALVMIAVVLADRVWGVQPLVVTSPPPNAQVDSFYKTINNLETQPGAPVLVAYDWDANRQAEMEPLARAVTCHLGAIKARFATVSLAPTGPAFAQRIAEATVDRTNPCTSRYQYGSDYVNLGYSAGGDFALRSMVGNIATVFSTDYVNGRPLFGAGGVAALKNVNRLSDFKLIIVLEGDESTARSWIEQVASQPNTPPLLLGEPAALDPSLQPYLTIAAPTRFFGKVAGLSDVARYQYDLTSKGLNMARTDLYFSLNTLSFAALLVALLIIIGNIVFIARLVNRRK